MGRKKKKKNDFRLLVDRCIFVDLGRKAKKKKSELFLNTIEFASVSGDKNGLNVKRNGKYYRSETYAGRRDVTDWRAVNTRCAASRGPCRRRR